MINNVLSLFVFFSCVWAYGSACWGVGGLCILHTDQLIPRFSSVRLCGDVLAPQLREVFSGLLWHLARTTPETLCKRLAALASQKCFDFANFENADVFIKKGVHKRNLPCREVPNADCIL